MIGRIHLVIRGWKPPLFPTCTIESIRAHAAGLNDLADGLQAAVDDLGVAAVMDQLIWTLHRYRMQMSAEQWRVFVTRCCAHRLCGLVHQDPFTRRAFEKPRGFAGDAVMLDYIYSLEERWPLPEMTLLGQRIFRYTSQAPSSRGVRARRGHIAYELDEASRRLHRPRALAIAGGHFREGSLAASIKRGLVGEVVVVDSDRQAMVRVDEDYGCYGVRGVCADARDLIRGKLDLGRFDLVYSTGLYDYLKPLTATRLTSRLFSMLQPGGRLVLANFLPEICDDGYMEAFMDWNLIYRTRHEMLALTHTIAESEIRRVQLFAEDELNIVFLVVERR